jgi:ribosome-binding protein aMBF1 (putative translation factor)
LAIAKTLKVTKEKDDEIVDWFAAPTSKQIAKRMTPGTCVKVYRENMGLTQEGLGEKISGKSSFISDIENGRLAISKDKAETFSKLFKVSLDQFL